MNITTDAMIMWKNDFFTINDTIFFTWIIMFLVISLALVLRVLITNEKNFGRLQNFFEVLITGIEEQIEKAGEIDVKYVFPFIATIFIFILVANLIHIIPFFHSPTASLSTNIALVIIVILTGVSYGIKRVGILNYLKKYTKPSWIMLPMNVVGDIASNCALVVRLYGNIMSAMVIGMIIEGIAFLSIGFPLFLNFLDLISGIIQAYIFSMLSLAFIMSAED
ncbi:MAG TPA: F0F1 ATP synthase subunit A [Rickettsiales bacterium]|nr:F0F1 ATP synthase subunit A [Rickettsiales bacterium]